METDHKVRFVDISTAAAAGAQSDQTVLLDVRQLKTYFYTDEGVVQAVNGVNFTVNRGEVLALVGESGSGKSVTALSIMRLVNPPGRIVEGEIVFESRDLLKASEHDMNNLRGNRLAMIFQQPTSFLNPVIRVGDQIAEVLTIHSGLEKEAGQRQAVALLHSVGVPDPEQRMKAYPHELSGGLAQRVMIAMALACVPDLLIADEPTTALDVTIQAQILDVMREMRAKLGTAIILITHDMGVVAEMADRVAVMYAGRIVEQAPVVDLFSSPQHPYTIGLMKSTPSLTLDQDRLEAIPGNVPDLIDLPPGCPFAPRCQPRIQNEAWLKGICTRIEPRLESTGHDHTAACWLLHRYEVERMQRDSSDNLFRKPQP
jgi:oligopeptide/dipeptide ABC transporter ATP-binding protein